MYLQDATFWGTVVIPASCGSWSHTWNLQPGAQTSYNRVHRKTRSIVERVIGQLKRRFHVLHGEVCLNPVKTCEMINVCAVLHNICKARNIPVPDEPLEDLAEANQGAQIHPHPARPAAHNGHPFWDYIANLYFK